MVAAAERNVRRQGIAAGRAETYNVLAANVLIDDGGDTLMGYPHDLTNSPLTQALIE